MDKSLCISLRHRLSVLVILCSSFAQGGCHSLFFYPQKDHLSNPGAFGYAYDDVFLQTADNLRVHGWLLKPRKPAIGTIYFLHGNAENVSTHFRAVLWLVNQNYEVFALDYRGYGLSQGVPTLPEVFLDIDAGAQWLVDRAKSADAAASEGRLPLFLYGQSLGASLATKYAELSKVAVAGFDGLILEAPFSRYDTIAKHVASNHWLTWLAQYPALWLINDKYDPVDAVGRIQQLPLLVIHSRQDQIIPQTFGRAVFDAANEPKYWIDTEGPHIRAAAYLSVRQGVLKFLEQYAR
jgi:pimeloyl-ACP methyl ester carboxylesterase